jgi:isopenicillin-N epimerase
MRRAPAAGVGPVDHDSAWPLDPSVTFLNHGSCGACPRAVLQAQQVWRDRMEAEPIDFLGRQLPGLMDSTRSTLAAFVGADPDDLAFVPNATAGVSTILRSVRFRPGDELLANNHEYNASLNALRFAAERDGARVVIAQIPFPIRDAGQVIEAILARVTRRTKIALISHVTSPTAVVFPIAELVHELARQGIDTLVDGAHAPGMLPLALDAIGAAYYTGNGHKWLCAPKGSAFLHVRRDRQAHVRPLAISHGANDSRTDQSRFRLEFDVVATMDPTPFLAMASAIQYMGSLMPGGWPEVMASNRALARAGRDLLCEALGVEGPVAVEMLGSMAMVPLGDHGSPPFRLTGAQIHEALFRMHHIEVPIYEWPAETVRDAGSPRPQPFVRISAQRYNTIGQYAMLADTLVRILGD